MAKDWLDGAVADGPVATTELTARAGEAGISEATLRRAKSALKVKSAREGYGETGVWRWEKPAPAGGEQGEEGGQEGTGPPGGKE